MGYFQSGNQKAFAKAINASPEILNLNGGKAWTALLARDLRNAVKFYEEHDPNTGLWSMIHTGNIFPYSLHLEPLSVLTALVRFELGNTEASIADAEKAKIFRVSIVETVVE